MLRLAFLLGSAGRAPNAPQTDFTSCGSNFANAGLRLVMSQAVRAERKLKLGRVNLETGAAATVRIRRRIIRRNGRLVRDRCNRRARSSNFFLAARASSRALNFLRVSRPRAARSDRSLPARFDIRAIHRSSCLIEKGLRFNSPPPVIR